MWCVRDVSECKIEEGNSMELSSRWELLKINSYAFGLEIVSGAAMTFIVPNLLSLGKSFINQFLSKSTVLQG